MSIKLRCPGCNHNKSLKDISMLAGGAWDCRGCQTMNLRDAWFQNTQNPAVPADTFFYHGPGTSQSRGGGMLRAMARPAAFAANFDKSAALLPLPNRMNNIRNQNTLTTNKGNHTEVTIYLVRDHVTLKGRYYQPPVAAHQKVVLLMSGSGGVAADQFARTVPKYLSKVQVPILMMDYRGFGRSTGTASSRGLYNDAEAMLEFLTAPVADKGLNWAGTDVVVHGYSLGSGPATDLAARHTTTVQPTIGGLILQCPMESSAANAGGGFNSWVAQHSFAFDNIAKIGQITRPILILNANNDQMRPQGLNLQQAAANNQLDPALANVNLPNVTQVDYTGDHLEPENAFRTTGVMTYQGQVLKMDGTNNNPFNMHTLNQQNAALPAIQNFFANLP